MQTSALIQFESRSTTNLAPYGNFLQDNEGLTVVLEMVDDDDDDDDDDDEDDDDRVHMPRTNLHFAEPPQTLVQITQRRLWLLL